MHAEASSVCVQSLTLSSRSLCRFGSPEPAQVPGLPPAASGNTEAATDLQRELDSIKQMLAQVCCSCLMPVSDRGRRGRHLAQNVRVLRASCVPATQR